MDEKALLALRERVRHTADARLSQTEVAALEDAAAGSGLARALLGMHYFRAGRFADAARHARASFETAPTPETARNLWSALLRSGNAEEALAHLNAAKAVLDAATLASCRCLTLNSLGRRSEAIAEGNRALALKDAASPDAALPDPVIRPFDPARPERNVIAFSLFGSAPRYCDGAIRNAIVAPHLYPGWTPRFYIDATVPAPVVARLAEEGAQLREFRKLPAARFGPFWRFLVEDDPDVDLYLVRDADAVLNIRERSAVAEWLDSGAPFHVMRDHPVHCELMLAGMWGAHRGNLGPMGRRVLAHVREHEARLNDRASDQLFLRQVVWPVVRSTALTHDAFYSLGRTRPFPSHTALPGKMHVGQDDSARRGKNGT